MILESWEEHLEGWLDSSINNILKEFSTKLHQNNKESNGQSNVIANGHPVEITSQHIIPNKFMGRQ
eukprot:9902884-Ditylum_brightwellii.AAC.1